MQVNPLVQEILTTYWSQFTLILAFLGFFVNRYFQNRDKEFELRQSLFQQEKVKAINVFISNYTQIEFIFTQLPYHQVFTFEITPKELDKLVFPTYNQFKSSYYSLLIFLTDEEQKDFDRLFDSMSQIQILIGKLLFQTGTSKDEMFEKKETYIASAYDAARSNKEILRLIGKKIRARYSK